MSSCFVVLFIKFVNFSLSFLLKTNKLVLDSIAVILGTISLRV